MSRFIHMLGRTGSLPIALTLILHGRTTDMTAAKTIADELQSRVSRLRSLTIRTHDDTAPGMFIQYLNKLTSLETLAVGDLYMDRFLTSSGSEESFVVYDVLEAPRLRHIDVRGILPLAPRINSSQPELASLQTVQCAVTCWDGFLAVLNISKHAKHLRLTVDSREVSPLSNFAERRDAERQARALLGAMSLQSITVVIQYNLEDACLVLALSEDAPVSNITAELLDEEPIDAHVDFMHSLAKPTSIECNVRQANHQSQSGSLRRYSLHVQADNQDGPARSRTLVVDLRFLEDSYAGIGLLHDALDPSALHSLQSLTVKESLLSVIFDRRDSDVEDESSIMTLLGVQTLTIVAATSGPSSPPTWGPRYMLKLPSLTEICITRERGNSDITTTYRADRLRAKFFKRLLRGPQFPSKVRRVTFAGVLLLDDAGTPMGAKEITAFMSPYTEVVVYDVSASGYRFASS